MCTAPTVTSPFRGLTLTLQRFKALSVSVKTSFFFHCVFLLHSLVKCCVNGAWNPVLKVPLITAAALLSFWVWAQCAQLHHQLTLDVSCSFGFSLFLFQSFDWTSYSVLHLIRLFTVWAFFSWVVFICFIWSSQTPTTELCIALKRHVMSQKCALTYKNFNVYFGFLKIS